MIIVGLIGLSHKIYHLFNYFTSRGVIYKTEKFIIIET